MKLWLLCMIFLPCVIYCGELNITEHRFGPAANPSTAVKIVDFNQDGKNDGIIVSVGRHDGGQSYICHFHKKQFVCNQKIGYGNSPTVGVETGNLDGDDKIDILLINGDCHKPAPACQNQSAAIIFLGKENYRIPHPITDLIGARSAAIADIDQNGLDDILLGFDDGKNNMLFLNQGKLNFEGITFDNFGYATLGMTVFYGENQKPYVITTSRAPWAAETQPHQNAIFYYVNQALVHSDSFGNNSQSVGVAVGKLKANPQQYIVVSNGGEADKPGQALQVWRVSDKGKIISEVKNPISKHPYRSRPVLLYDVNNDGLNDIIVGNLNESMTGFQPEASVIYLNNGGLSFAPNPIPGSAQYEPRGMDIGIFDGKLYLFSANYCVLAGTDCYSKLYEIEQ